MNYLSLYGITLPILAVMDFLWIGILAKGFYKSQLGPLLSSTPVWWAAILFYVLYAAALVFFVIQPGIMSRSLLFTVLTGIFFGLVAFGTYDLTNMTTVPNWTVLMTVVDMAWGAFAAGVVSGAAYLIATAVFGF